MKQYTFSISKETSNTVKVIAALMVMLHHYSQYILADGNSNSIIFKLLSYQGGYLGVAIFFFLSGYGLMESEQRSHLDIYAFFKRRFLKIYLPVLLVTAIWMLISPFLINIPQFEGIPLKMGGGKQLILSNIFTNFGDGVLWFIKVLFALYSIFYLFSAIYKKNKISGLAFLVIMTVAATVIESKMVDPSKSISIPFFSLGVLMSLYKSRKNKTIISSELILILFAALGFLFYRSGTAGHSAINAVIIGSFILLLSIRKWQIQIPTILGAVSFDLYLIHNKVLQALKHNTDEVSLWIFVIVTIMATLLFYFIRTKAFRI